VVRAKLDKKGKVIDTVVLAGHPLLAPACVENIKKWVFDPNSTKTPVVVYSFRLDSGDQTQLFFEPPNFVTITAAAVVVNPETSTQDH
jgi:hypothetical protein